MNANLVKIKSMSTTGVVIVVVPNAKVSSGYSGRINYPKNYFDVHTYI